MIWSDDQEREAQGAGHTVELGAVHRLTDGDTAMSPTCHRIPRHTIVDREVPGRLGGRQIRNAHGGHPAQVYKVPHHCPQGGVGEALGTNVSQPGALGEATDGSAMDNRAEDGRCLTSR